jgi:putative selenium metabolism hydrolase
MNTDRLVEFAADLVKRPSLSCQEEAVARRVQDEMESLGFDGVSVDENGSVVGVLEGAGEGRTILLDAHTDTVDVEGGVAWKRDPFGGGVEHGVLFGRGSADMKGALAAMVHGAAAADRGELRGKVVVSASVMEEVLEGVALKAVMDRHPPDVVVIGEATDLNLVRGGRGRVELHLETVGIPTHSSAPHLGRNAVLDMAKVMMALEEMSLPEHPLMGPAVLVLTEISSVPFPANSVVPSLCRTTWDRRLLPGEEAGDVLDALGEATNKLDVGLNAKVGVGEYEAFTGRTLRKEKFFPAWELPEDHWLVGRALEGLSVAGLEAEIRAYRFCTNAAYSAGEAGVPTVGFGPAKEADAHRVDESLKLDDLEAAARGYRGIIESVLR